MHPLFLSHPLVSDLNLPWPYPRIALSGPEVGVRDAGMLYVHLCNFVSHEVMFYKLYFQVEKVSRSSSQNSAKIKAVSCEKKKKKKSIYFTSDCQKAETEINYLKKKKSVEFLFSHVREHIFFFTEFAIFSVTTEKTPFSRVK